MKVLLAALLATALVSGCGSTHKVNVQGTTTISKGQELTDLQRALAEGAISQAEYDRVRNKILRWSN